MPGFLTIKSTDLNYVLTSTAANFQQISYGEANVSEFLEPSRNLAMVATTNREHRLCLCLVNNP